MIACVDVDYRVTEALAACVLFDDWTDPAPRNTLTEPIGAIQPYEPGQFYKRELPCLLAVLGKVLGPIHVVVVDGYVWLSYETRPGLGAHLFEAMDKVIPVVGVAKTRFQGATAARAVLRGNSQRPLYVTAVGMDLDLACRHIASMHGKYRIPTLLKQVDQLCRMA